MRRDMINLRRRMRKMGTKLPPPYPNGWFALLESVELKVGEVKQVDSIGENFAVFRTLDGKVHVTDAYCPHLGASLAVGGTIQGDCIECPFHKWRFNSTSGKCVSIPNIETVPRGVGLKVWTSIEIDEAIFVWYDKEGRSPDWEIPAVEDIKKGNWIYHARNEFLISSHIQDIPENGADVAHLNAIHSDHLMAGKSLPTTDCWNALGFHEWNGKWESTDIPHEARVSITHEVKLFNRFTMIKFDVEARQIGASYVQLKLSHRFGRVIFLQTVTPLEPLLQKVVHRVYAPWYIRPLANFMMWGETVMFHRDVMIWNKKQFVHNPQLVKTDKCIKAFRSWFQQFYTENSITFKDAILGPKKDLIDW
ncbi:cholesterol 7-desaturase nvd [Arctopsyche grandis]|uniref:cholesterol 7-desaturase nvd n=1 Tax=Arctopsyche grandis TaxID=121162 RepID=UPI00406D6518